MSASTRPDVRACAECRLTFSSRRSLRRHEAMDHRPAPDGARLTAQLVEGQRQELEPHVATSDDGGGTPVLLADPPGAPAPDPATPSPARLTPTGPDVTVLGVVALVALVLGHGLHVALAAAVLTWALCRARSSLAGLHARSRRPDPEEFP